MVIFGRNFAKWQVLFMIILSYLSLFYLSIGLDSKVIFYISMISLPLSLNILSDIYSKNGSGKVILRSAPKGTGIIAGGAIRAVCEMSGIQDIVAKSLGSSNSYNIINACLEALKKQSSPKLVSEKRGKKISEIIKKKTSSLNI